MNAGVEELKEQIDAAESAIQEVNSVAAKLEHEKNEVCV